MGALARNGLWRILVRNGLRLELGNYILHYQSGPNLDKNSIQLAHPASFCENYAKLYFDAKHLKKEWNRGW